MTGTYFEKVWLITGCSPGLGRDLARRAIERGYRVNVGDLLAAFEKLAEEAEPFGSYPIVYLKP
jgi:NAD(P)-dependent dehydrogenase (short-subunit alcohol dehydrogenase family)